MTQRHPLQAFAYNAQPIRIVERDGEPWFVLKDVCDVLGLGSPHKVAERLDEDERSLVPITDALGRQQETAVVSESGLYAVILRSDKPEAKPFRRWVTAQVLPSIRRNGFYELPQRLNARRSKAHPTLPKAFYTSSTCHVCTSPLAYDIDQMLTGNLLAEDGKRFTYEEILLWARMQGLTLSGGGLSRHRNMHLMPRLNPEGHTATRGELDGVLKRLMRDAAREVMTEMLNEVQRQGRRATAQAARRAGSDTLDEDADDDVKSDTTRLQS